MSQTFDTIERLKDNSLINENTYMLLMNAMKCDYDRGRMENPSATQTERPHTAPPVQPHTFDEESIQLLFSIGLCRINDELCIDETVTLSKLKQLARACKIKGFSKLPKHHLFLLLKYNLNNIKTLFNLH